MKEKDNLEDIMSQLQSPENSELMNLANSLMKDLNLEEKLKNGTDSLDFTQLADLMATVGGYVQDKMTSGQLNLQDLEAQASSFYNKIQNSDEFKDTMQSNPQLSSTLLGLGELSNMFV